MVSRHRLEPFDDVVLPGLLSEVLLTGVYPRQLSRVRHRRLA